MKKHGVSHHCYADDTQVYLPLKPGGPDVVKSLFDSLNDIKHWMASNFLKISKSNMEILIFGSPSVAKNLTCDLGPLPGYVKCYSKNFIS